MAIDTLKTARRLREAGFPESQAEAVVAVVQRAGKSADLATEADLAEVRAGIREIELRFEAKLEAVKTDILNRVLGMLRGALVVKIVAIFGATFDVAKLLGH
jgi:hypothetical protein